MWLIWSRNSSRLPSSQFLPSPVSTGREQRFDFSEREASSLAHGHYGEGVEYLDRVLAAQAVAVCAGNDLFALVVPQR